MEDSLLWTRLASMSAPLLVLDRNICFWPCLRARVLRSRQSESCSRCCFFLCCVHGGGGNIDRSCQNGASSLLIPKSAEKIKQAARSQQRCGRNSELKSACSTVDLLVAFGKGRSCHFHSPCPRLAYNSDPVSRNSKFHHFFFQ